MAVNTAFVAVGFLASLATARITFKNGKRLGSDEDESTELGVRNTTDAQVGK